LTNLPITSQLNSCVRNDINCVPLLCNGIRQVGGTVHLADTAVGIAM